jgi:hypothetical protein
MTNLSTLLGITFSGAQGIQGVQGITGSVSGKAIILPIVFGR